MNAGDIVERQVAAGRGAKTAVVAEDATLTYDGLRRQINRAGGALRELGVRREQRVLLVLDDTAAFPIAFLGAMRIGAVPVPVSPRGKDDNFRHFVEDSYAEVVVDAALLDRLAEILAGHDLRWLVTGEEANCGRRRRHASRRRRYHPAGGHERPGGRARGGGHAPRRHGVLALQLGLDR